MVSPKDRSKLGQFGPPSPKFGTHNPKFSTEPSQNEPSRPQILVMSAGNEPLPLMAAPNAP